MILPRDGNLLRIFIGENDKYEGQPLYEWIVHKARERRCSVDSRVPARIAGCTLQKLFASQAIS